jgi:hypothetical protein
MAKAVIFGDYIRTSVYKMEITESNSLSDEEGALISKCDSRPIHICCRQSRASANDLSALPRRSCIRVVMEIVDEVVPLRHDDLEVSVGA